MTLSDHSPSGLHARKQVGEEQGTPPLIRNRGTDRPPLRLVAPATQVAEPPPEPAEDDSPLTHEGGLAGALTSHPAAATHPPTVASAAASIWLHRDQVRHGFAGQVGAAAAGVAQIVGLGICWGIAHTLFASKSRSVISMLVLLAAFAALAIASHA